MENWKGKVAVITGASAGIGAATAIKLAEHGVTVVGLARRQERILELAEQHKNLPGKIYSHACDIMDADSITTAFDYIEKCYGGVDILINNAGTRRKAETLDLNTPDEDYTLTINTNLTGLLLCTRRAFKTMKTKPIGYIINVNSVAGHMTPNATYVGMGANVYGATKHALTNLTDTLRLELAVADDKRIRVTSLSPGLVETEFAKTARSDPGLYKTRPALSADDVADAVIYLLGTKPSVNISELTIHPTGEKF